MVLFFCHVGWHFVSFFNECVLQVHTEGIDVCVQTNSIGQKLNNGFATHSHTHTHQLWHMKSQKKKNRNSRLCCYSQMCSLIFNSWHEVFARTIVLVTGNLMFYFIQMDAIWSNQSFKKKGSSRIKTTNDLYLPIEIRSSINMALSTERGYTIVNNKNATTTSPFLSHSNRPIQSASIRSHSDINTTYARTAYYHRECIFSCRFLLLSHASRKERENTNKRHNLNWRLFQSHIVKLTKLKKNNKCMQERATRDLFFYFFILWFLFLSYLLSIIYQMNRKYVHIIQMQNFSFVNFLCLEIFAHNQRQWCKSLLFFLVSFRFSFEWDSVGFNKTVMGTQLR